MTRIPKTTPPKACNFAPATPADETMAYYAPLPFAAALRDMGPLDQMYGYYAAD
jgi:hypothetical protein